MAIYRMFKDTAFDPEELRVMGAAFEAAIAALGLDWGDPIVEQVAIKVIELGERGERDPQRLRDFTIMAFTPPKRE